MQIIAQGKYIGDLRDDTFYKKVEASKHLFKILDAWGIDHDVFTSKLQGKNIRILDKDSGLVYFTDANTFNTHGVVKDFGHGKQIFLPRKYFQTENPRQKPLI